MYINPITNNLNNNINFQGEVYFLNSLGNRKLPSLRAKFEKEMPKLEKLIKDKDYNLYIAPNKRNADLYNIDANTSFKNVTECPTGRVKVHKTAIEAITTAAQDAINIFEEHLSYVKNRAKIDAK